jgi:hypothetical protein
VIERFLDFWYRRGWIFWVVKILLQEAMTLVFWAEVNQFRVVALLWLICDFLWLYQWVCTANARRQHSTYHAGGNLR